MKPQKLSIVNGRRTTIDYDSRKEEYRDYNRNRWKYDKFQSTHPCGVRQVTAYKKGSSIQELVNEILADHQAKDPEYQGALNDLVTDSLTALASITQDGEVSRGV